MPLTIWLLDRMTQAGNEVDGDTVPTTKGGQIIPTADILYSVWVTPNRLSIASIALFLPS